MYKYSLPIQSTILKNLVVCVFYISKVASLSFWKIIIIFGHIIHIESEILKNAILKFCPILSSLKTWSIEFHFVLSIDHKDTSNDDSKNGSFTFRIFWLKNQRLQAPFSVCGGPLKNCALLVKQEPSKVCQMVLQFETVRQTSDMFRTRKNCSFKRTVRSSFKRSIAS